MSYLIATSSTSDLPRSYLEEHGIPFIPYSFTVNDQPAEDDCREESRAAVYAGMRKGDLLKTSMINEFLQDAAGQRQGRHFPGHVREDVRLL